MSESEEINRAGLTYTTLTDNLRNFLLTVQSNLRSLRFFMINFTLKCSENNDFLRYFCF